MSIHPYLLGSLPPWRAVLVRFDGRVPAREEIPESDQNDQTDGSRGGEIAASSLRVIRAAVDRFLTVAGLSEVGATPAELLRGQSHRLHKPINTI